MDSNSFANKYFGPLSKEWCTYFYVLSIFFFIVFLAILVAVVVTIITSFSKINLHIATNLAVILLNSFIAYFINRLFYSMCINSLQ